MKKEAVDRQLDFVISIDEQGYLAESATENLMVLDKNGILVHPHFDYILKGTTMVRVCELARKNGFSTAIRSISIDELQSAREVMLVGTTINVLPAVKFEDTSIGNGKPGPVAKKLNGLLLNDMQSSASHLLGKALA